MTYSGHCPVSGARQEFDFVVSLRRKLVLHGKHDRNNTTKNGCERIVCCRLFVRGDFLEMLCTVEVHYKGFAGITVSVHVQVRPPIVAGLRIFVVCRGFQIILKHFSALIIPPNRIPVILVPVRVVIYCN